MNQAMIFIPGIMGSVLKDGDDVVWPGTATGFFGAYDRMNALLKPDLEAADVIRKVFVMDQYGGLITALQPAGITEANGTLVVHPYDWRKDNALAAEGLAERIDAVLAERGPDVEILLLAHSMGGLVARYYLESGRFLQRQGFGHVHTLVTMGTPHRGAPVALAGALGLEKKLWLSASQVKTLAEHPDFPSLYQLLPPRGEPFLWDRTMDRRSAPLDVYEPVLAQRLGLSLSNLAAAEIFHRQLDLARKPAHIRYFTFTGNLKSTVHAMHIINPRKPRPVVQQYEHPGGGDGTVPIWSALLPGTQGDLVDGAHGTIFQAKALLNLLGNLLGYKGTLPAPAAAVVLKDQVVDIDAATEITLELDAPCGNLEGKLELKRVTDASGAALAADVPPLAEHPLAYKGPAIQRLDMTVTAPSYAGAYEIRFVRQQAPSTAPVTLFVQRSRTVQAPAAGGVKNQSAV